ALAIQHLHDVGLVWTSAFSQVSPSADNPGELADRAAGVCLASSGQPIRVRPIHGGATQAHSGSYLHRGLCRLQLLLSEGSADLANGTGILADFRGAGAGRARAVEACVRSTLPISAPGTGVACNGVNVSWFVPPGTSWRSCV